MLENRRILVTGPTSQVAFPVARELAKSNEVFGLARFSKDADVERVESIGVNVVRADLATSDFSEVPDAIDYVLNFAVVKTDDFAGGKLWCFHTFG